jgi:aminoglycoside phosphotransferase (APT) family kinase protein
VLVHGDVSPKNVLIGPRGPVLLDAECAWYGDPAFDVAFCLNHLLLKSAWRPASIARLMESFDEFTTAYFAHVEWEDRAALDARASALLPALLLARMSGKSPVEYIGELHRAADLKAFAKHWLRAPASQLAELGAAWTRERTT